MKQPRNIRFIEIERAFRVDEASYWFGAKWCPAVDRKADGSYLIRIVSRASRSGNSSHIGFDYFYLDADGLITTAPRGFARDYKPGRVVDIAEVVDRFAAPQPGARRIA